MKENLDHTNLEKSLFVRWYKSSSDMEECLIQEKQSHSLQNIRVAFYSNTKSLRLETLFKHIYDMLGMERPTYYIDAGS